MRRAAAVAGLAVLVAGAAVGCGGGASDGGPEATEANPLVVWINGDWEQATIAGAMFDLSRSKWRRVGVEPARGKYSSISVSRSLSGATAVLWVESISRGTSATPKSRLVVRSVSADGKVTGRTVVSESEAPIARSAVSFASGKRISVAWVEGSMGEGFAGAKRQLWSATFEPGVRSTTPVSISKSASPGSLAIAQRHDGSSLIAWSRFDAEERVPVVLTEIDSKGTVGPELVVSEPATITRSVHLGVRDPDAFAVAWTEAPSPYDADGKPKLKVRVSREDGSLGTCCSTLHADDKSSASPELLPGESSQGVQVLPDGNAQIVWIKTLGRAGRGIASVVRADAARSAPEVITEPAEWGPQISTAGRSDGSMAVAWRGFVGGGPSGAIGFSALSPDGVWSPAATLSTARRENGSPSVAMSPEGRKWVAWTILRTSGDVSVLGAEVGADGQLIGQADLGLMYRTLREMSPNGQSGPLVAG